jgi:hypothetical protein
LHDLHQKSIRILVVSSEYQLILDKLLFSLRDNNQVSSRNTTGVAHAHLYKANLGSEKLFKGIGDQDVRYSD